MEQRISTADRFQRVYGVATVSEPWSLSLDEVEEAIRIETSYLNFEKALAEAKNIQSAGSRRFSVVTEAGLRASADALAAQQLLQAAEAGVQPTAVPTAPGLPAEPGASSVPSAFTTLPDIISGQSLSLPLRPRIQTALNNVMLAKLGGSQLGHLQKLKDDYDLSVVFNTLTVQPGELTRLNSQAEVRVKWSLGTETGRSAAPGKSYPESELSVIPIFPTYDAVAELNDAASMMQLRTFIAALVQYGPAQAQGEFQQTITDLQRLISVSERVTLLGSQLAEDTIHYRISGVRVARPFDELRPRGTVAMEPMTIPIVTLVMRKKPKPDDNAYALNYLGMAWSGRWLRDRPWWDRWIPPGSFYDGFWYNRGTRFARPDYGVENYSGTVWDKNRGIYCVETDDEGWPFVLSPSRWTGEDYDFITPARRAGFYIAGGFSKTSTEPRFFVGCTDAGPDSPGAYSTAAPASHAISHPYNQSVLVKGTGSAPQLWLVGGIPVEGRRVAVDRGEKVLNGTNATTTVSTYEILLTNEILTNLGKAHGIRPRDLDSARIAAEGKCPEANSPKGSCPKVMVEAVNARGITTGVAELELCFSVFYPAEPAPERIEVQEKDKPVTTILRRKGQQWPDGAYGGGGSQGKSGGGSGRGAEEGQQDTAKEKGKPSAGTGQVNGKKEE